MEIPVTTMPMNTNVNPGGVARTNVSLKAILITKCPECRRHHRNANRVLGLPLGTLDSIMMFVYIMINHLHQS
jgi:hypothetical protein